MRKLKYLAIIILISISAIFMLLGCTKNQSNFTTIYEKDFLKNIPIQDYIYPNQSVDGSAFRLVDFGGVGDAKTDNTAAFKNAIKAIEANEGGTLLVDGGSFVTGSIELPNNITIYVKSKSAIISSTDNSKLQKGLFFADSKSYIRFCGGGKIDGRGEYFFSKPEIEPQSPSREKIDIRELAKLPLKQLRHPLKKVNAVNLLNFNNCRNVYIDNLELFNSASNASVLFERCNGVSISNTVISNNLNAFGLDGVRLSGTKNTLISKSYISTSQNGILIQNPKYDSENNISKININNCIILATSNCFKIGEETFGGISEVTLSNCNFLMESNTAYSPVGISIESLDGSNISKIKIDKITMQNISASFYVKLGNRNLFNSKKPDGGIDGLEISNIVAKNIELPSYISGYDLLFTKKQNIKNVKINNINLSYRECKEKVYSKKSVPFLYKSPNGLLEFKDLPAYGLYARYVENLDVKEFTATPRSANKRTEFKYVYIT